MNVHIVVHKGSERTVLNAEKGSPVSSVLREAGLLPLPCGVGKCGKCIIYAETAPCAEEMRILGEEKTANGLRLACYTKAEEGLALTIPSKHELEVLTAFSKIDYPYAPLVKRVKTAIEEPTLEDQRPDLQRLLDASGCSSAFLSHKRLKELPYALRNGQAAYAAVENNDLLGFSDNEAGCGFIVDIGTTTVAVMLVDGTRQQIIAALGRQNAQASYGADVISRIHREIEWQNEGRKGKTR